MIGQFAREVVMLSDSRLELPKIMNSNPAFSELEYVDADFQADVYTTHKNLLLTQPSLAHLALHFTLVPDSPPARDFRVIHL